MGKTKKNNDAKNGNGKKNGNGRKNGNGKNGNMSKGRKEEIASVLHNGKPSESLIKKAAGQLIFDPRSSLNSEENIYIENANPQIPYSVPMDAESLIGPVLAVVSFAISRGWAEIVDDDSYPYYSFVYHIDTLQRAVENVTPLFTSCPRWLNLLMQGLNRKTIRTQGGSVNYVFDLQTNYTPDWTQSIGPAVYGRKWNIGVKDATKINVIFNKIVAPTAYTEDLGQRAAQSLWQFLGSMNLPTDMHQMTEVNKKNKMTNDASSFACLITSPGGGIGNTGGWAQIVYQEVPIRSPMFSVFKTNTNNFLDAGRFQRFERQFSGDGCQLGGYLVSKLMSSQISFKTPPKIHFVDFNMFATELAYFVCLVQTNALADTDTIEAINADPSYFADNIQCPLTIQEMSILLRGVMMEAFQSSQFCYQTLFPRTAQQGDNEFVAFASGFGTTSMPGTTDMQIPILLKENILALTERTVYSSRGGKSNPIFFVPCLGAYNGDKLKTKDFTVKLPDGETEETCFVVVPGEVPINIIDGQSGIDYVCINDPQALIILSQKWNEWQQKNSNYMHTMAAIGSDRGMDPLYSGCMTEHWSQGAPQTMGNQPKKGTAGKVRKKSKGKKQLTPMEKRFKKIEVTETDSIYADRSLLAITSAVRPYKNAWESIQQYFIKPINKVDSSTQIGQFTAFTSIAAYEGEMIQLNVGYGEVAFISYSQKLRNAAQLMVKQKFTETQELTEMLNEAERKGEGGILSSLAATLAGKLVPGAKPILEGIANALPI